jgi:hypothetical protein
MRGTMPRWLRRLMTATAVGLIAITPLTGPAAAAPVDEAGPGLQVTKAQELELDRQIAEQLKIAPGGKRISVNQIAWARDGAEPVIMTFPVPGERIARAAGEPITPLGTPNCNYEGVCLWDFTNFEGSRVGPFYACRTENLANHGFANRTESWQNNQTPNTKSWLVQNGQILMDMIPNSKVSHVGVYNVNRATHLTVC